MYLIKDFFEGLLFFAKLSYQFNPLLFLVGFSCGVFLWGFVSFLWGFPMGFRLTHRQSKHHIIRLKFLGQNRSCPSKVIPSGQNLVHDRILLESIPSSGDNLQLFIEAMKSSRRITVTYRKHGNIEPSVRTVEPYCIKLFQRRWYALVRLITRDSLFALSFDRILDIQLTEESFKIDQDFDAQSWFSDCYGVVRNPDADLERVIIRAYGRESYYLRDLPFHHSQREIASGEDWTDYEYLLRISSDFYTPLLSRGPNIKVGFEVPEGCSPTYTSKKSTKGKRGRPPRPKVETS